MRTAGSVAETHSRMCREGSAIFFDFYCIINFLRVSMPYFVGVNPKKCLTALGKLAIMTALEWGD